MAPGSGADAMRLIVLPEHAGQRLDKVISRLLPDTSRATIQRWILESRVSVNGGSCRARDRVQAGSVIELEPGNALGEHTDSPEEVLLVLEGVVEFTVGGERARAGRGTLAVVPPMVPHSIRNVGNDTARVVGFFPSPTVVATFIEAIQPLGERVLVVGDRAHRERLPELRSSRPLASR